MSAPYGLSIYCDDVRHEVDGKTSFIGTYGNELNIKADGPVFLPTLHVVTLLIIPAGILPNQIRFVINLYKDGENAVISEIVAEPDNNTKGEIDAELKELAKDTDPTEIFHQHRAIHKFSPFKIDESLRLQSRVFIDNQPAVKCGTLKINFIQESPKAPKHST